MKKRIRAISLFSGAGGMDLGFRKAGVEVVWANDFNKAACETYRKNFGDEIHCGSITDFDYETLPDCDLVFGGHVRFEVLDSQYYSTPQRRERLIMIGTTDEIETFPFPAPSEKLITAREVLSGFDKPGTGNNKGVCEARITLAKHPVLRVSAYAGMLFNGMGRPIDLSRPCQTLPASMGGNKTPIIDTRLLKDATAPDWLKTIHVKIIKGADVSKTRVPKFMRRITVSEAAALQGFPKDFEFCGSQCYKYKQIGNSVPPPFAYAIAREIIRRFTDR